jgi:hypothetical protein
MKDLNKKYYKHLNNLISWGSHYVKLAAEASSKLSGDDITEISAWVTQSGQMIRTICAPNSIYLEQFDSIMKTKEFFNLHSNRHSHLAELLGCIIAVRDDLKSGMLNNYKDIIVAEIFDDFFDMAEYLLKHGYKDASAVIIGAVLEDNLRQMCIKKTIKLKKDNDKPKNMETLNQDLYKQGAYDKLRYKQVISWGELRNNAAHGDFDKYDEPQVKLMLIGVRQFCSDFN